MARVNPRLLAACAALAAGVLRGAGVAAQSATPSATVLSSATTTRTASGTASFLPGSWGVITTVAGNGVGGFSGDGGPATSASLNGPVGVAVDGGGNLLIADNGNHRIRRLAAGTGVITTVAGTGARGFSGDGGPGTSARLQYPTGLAMDGGGNLFIADQQNHRIRRMAAGTGIITTVAGNGVQGFSGDGGLATSAHLNHPTELVLDGSDVIIADAHNHRIRRVAMDTGVITTVAGTGVGSFSGDGGPATSATLMYPIGVVMDSGGNLLIVDKNNHRVRRVAAGTGVITTVAGTGAIGFGGDGGPASNASLTNPWGLVVDARGNVFISEGYESYRDSSRIRIVLAPTQPSPPPTPTSTITPYCAPALFRPLPRTDLVGTLVGTALAPGESALVPSEAACRQACCDAAACDGYSFEASVGRRLGSADCYLLVNVTQLVPSNGYASGLRESALL